ncbi:MAG: DUF3575 domain-containing protein [Flavobacteriales bacterium]|nr:DUF3575 domain-containing protein [Flavobacteriales bacterium]
MKKIALVLLLLCVYGAYAQEDNPGSFAKNEIKLNMLYFVLGATEVSYERNISEDSSLGIALLIPTSEEARWNINYVLTPYYRLFFGNKPAQGFFLEGFGMLNSTKENTYIYFEDTTEDIYSYREEKKNVVDFALGIAIGSKFVLREKIVAEVTGGIGRNLLQNNEYQYTSIVPRFNIGVGYRF